MSRACVSWCSPRAVLVAAVVAAVVVPGALGGCGRTMPPKATLFDAQRANVALAELDKGRSLVIRKCGNCHRPPMPAEYPPSEWPRKVDAMAPRSNLDAEQRRAIQQYLVVMATAPAPAPGPVAK